MSGILLHLLPKRLLSFDTLTVGTTDSFTLAERIDISQYHSVSLIIRVHSFTAGGSNLMQLVLSADGFMDEDPSLTFTKPLTLLNLDSTIVAPTLRSAIMLGIGQYFSLQLTGSRVSASPLNGMLSMDLLLRSPDD